MYAPPEAAGHSSSRFASVKPPTPLAVGLACVLSFRGLVHGHTFTQRYRENLAQVESIAQAFADVSLTAIFQRLYETRLAMSVRFDSYLSAGGSMDYHEFVLEQPDFTDHAYV